MYIEYGEVPGSQPTVRNYQNTNRMVSMDLKNNDIDGAQAESALKVIKSIKTHDLAYNVDDIEGAKASTRRKGIATNRHINPLTPSYQLPGHSEMPPDFTINSRGPKTLMRNSERSTFDFSGKKSGEFSNQNIFSVNQSGKQTLSQREEFLKGSRSVSEFGKGTPGRNIGAANDTRPFANIFEKNTNNVNPFQAAAGQSLLRGSYTNLPLPNSKDVDAFFGTEEVNRQSSNGRGFQRESIKSDASNPLSHNSGRLSQSQQFEGMDQMSGVTIVKSSLI